MDLGSAICTPKRPACMSCPLDRRLRGAQARHPGKLPVKAPEGAASAEARRGVRRARRDGRGAAGEAAGEGIARRHAAAAARPVDGGFPVTSRGAEAGAVRGGLEEAPRHRPPRLHAFRTGNRSLCRRTSPSVPRSTGRWVTTRRCSTVALAHRDAQDRSTHGLRSKADRCRCRLTTRSARKR